MCRLNKKGIVLYVCSVQMLNGDLPNQVFVNGNDEAGLVGVRAATSSVAYFGCFCETRVKSKRGDGSIVNKTKNRK